MTLELSEVIPIPETPTKVLREARSEATMEIPDPTSSRESPMVILEEELVKVVLGPASRGLSK